MTLVLVNTVRHIGVLVSFIVDFNQYDLIVTFIRSLVFSGSKVEITVRATCDVSFRPVLHLHYLHCYPLFYPNLQGKGTLVALYQSQVLLQQKYLTSILRKVYLQEDQMLILLCEILLQNEKYQ